MKKEIIFVSAIQFLFSACNFINTQKESNYNFIKGLNEYQKEDKISALEDYKKAYSSNKNNIYIINELAYLYSDLGNLEEAKRYYKEALTIKSNDENSLKNILELLYVEKNLNEMKEYIILVLDRNSYLYNLNRLRIAILEDSISDLDYYLKKIYISNEYIQKELDIRFFQDLNEITSKYQHLKNICFEIFKKSNNYYRNNKDFILLYSEFLIIIGKNEKAEGILLKNLVNDDSSINEVILLERIYKEERNFKKLENLKKFINKK